jgi:hypothetical protein
VSFMMCYDLFMERKIFVVIFVILISLLLISCSFFSQILMGSRTDVDEIFLAASITSSVTNQELTATQMISLATSSEIVKSTPQPEGDFPTDVPTGSIGGIAFHDLDGDGLKNDHEPIITDLLVCVGELHSPLCTQTDPKGKYTLANLPLGEAKIYLQNINKNSYEMFRYVNLFEEWQKIPAMQVWENWVPQQELPRTKLSRIENPLLVNISSSTEVNLALMQGYLTDIFRCGERQTKNILTFQAFDLDPSVGLVRHYYENESRTFENEYAIMFGDNHYAIDWGNINLNIIGTPLYAPANGIVVFAGEGDTWNGKCNVVNLVHPETGDSSGVVHLDTVLVKERQEVLRGQLLGTLGMDCTTWPHVHFYFKLGYDRETGAWDGRDPYRDTNDPESVSYWTVDNEPHCPAFLGWGD